MKDIQALIDSMILNDVLRTPRIMEAFREVDRKYFVPASFDAYIYVDAPLPIGEAQTISQPSTVSFMLELLEPQEGDKVLDIGSGSGWTTALLCHIVGERGSVEGLERKDALVEKGRENLAKFKFGSRCSIGKAGEALGRPGETFDRILVSASSDEIPEVLFEQLKPEGVLVIPVRNSIFRFRKLPDGRITKEEYPGFRFVPRIY
jgi:protein-L-isoaspartate(D-aspartate) O-methyltransferase